jgi:hypothetical protein
MVKKRKFLDKDGVEAVCFEIDKGRSGSIYGDFFFPSDLHLSVFTDVKGTVVNMTAVKTLQDMLSQFEYEFNLAIDKQTAKDEIETSKQVKDTKSIADLFRESTFGLSRVKEEGKTTKPAKQATKKTSPTKIKVK